MTLLTERQRQVLELWRQGYTQEEMAERLGCDQSTVCREIQRAADLVRWLSA
jgi:RNA polymerase sigma factor (sigma-70 family)